MIDFFQAFLSMIPQNCIISLRGKSGGARSWREGSYELKHNHQAEESQKVLNLLVDWKNTFVRVVPPGHRRNNGLRQSNQ